MGSEMCIRDRRYTDSRVAQNILDEWPQILSQFKKVMPTDYKRVLAERRKHDEEMESRLHEDDTGTLAGAGR